MLRPFVEKLRWLKMGRFWLQMQDTKRPRRLGAAFDEVGERGLSRGGQDHDFHTPVLRLAFWREVIRNRLGFSAAKGLDPAEGNA